MRKDKKLLKQSYLYKYLDIYYPNGVPTDPSVIYPNLPDDKLKGVQRDMEALLNGIVQSHNKNIDAISKRLKNISRLAPNAKVEITNLGNPTWVSDEQGNIIIDIRVLQAMFRGTLLASFTDSNGDMDSGYSIFHQNKQIDYEPDKETDKQKKAIKGAIDLKNKIDEIPGVPKVAMPFYILKQLFGDGDDIGNSPLFMSSEISFSSLKMQVNYQGACLFLMAHEYGHLSLGHYAELREMRLKSKCDPCADTSSFCKRRRQFEVEADAYALLVLDTGVHLPGGDFFGLSSDAKGYDSVLTFGYPLSGFQIDNHAECQYPSVRERYTQLTKLDKAVISDAENDFITVLDEALRAAD